jgi:hypothetical protein
MNLPGKRDAQTCEQSEHQSMEERLPPVILIYLKPHVTAICSPYRHPTQIREINQHSISDLANPHSL